MAGRSTARWSCLWRALALATLVCMVPQMGLALDVAGVARVIDGDTLDIEGLGIRLHGIDTPETGQTCSRADGSSWACGKAARDRLVALADHKRVRCTGSKWAPRRRLIAVCHAGDTELQGVLIREGLAWAFVRYSQDYAPRESEARTAKRGIWAGTAQPPWEYRAERWTAGTSVAPANCPIKGNVNAKGRRLYFVPWHRAYARVKISPDKGERWFCDEAEALAAGWQAAP